MKYTKRLQLLLELHKISNYNSVSLGNFTNFEIKINGNILTIHPKNLTDVGSSLYKVDISGNKSIDEILEKLIKQAECLPDAKDRIKNIEKIMGDEEFKNKLQTTLDNLEENQNKVAA